jgi:hypothetical protein
VFGLLQRFPRGYTHGNSGGTDKNVGRLGMVHSHVMLDEFGFTYEPVCVDYECCEKYLEEDD